MIIRKTTKEYKRLVDTNKVNKYSTTVQHTEKILEITYWLFNIIPVYTSEKIVTTTM